MLKKYIREEVIKDSLFSVESEMMSIKESILAQMIIEGVDDPGILKCVFMAGGPGSGKSFTAMEIFGIDKKLKSSFSATGLKNVNSDSAFEAGLKKHGINPKDLADIEKNNPEELLDKLSLLFSNLEKAKEMGKNGKEFVKNNFNWDKICNDFLNHLKKHNIGDI